MENITPTTEVINAPDPYEIELTALFETDPDELKGWVSLEI